MQLDQLGYSGFFQREFTTHEASGCVPARVIRQDRHDAYLLAGDFGELSAQPGGALLHAAHDPSDLPAVGDFVAVLIPDGADFGLIQAVLPRRTRLARKAAGRTSASQVAAANIDLVLLVMGLDADFNPRRLARGLALAHGAGAKAAVVLSKADLADDLDTCLAEALCVAGDAPVLPASMHDPDSIERVRALLEPGHTAVMLGSSGVGKSTLLNALLGVETAATATVRPSDGRGRHTTTRRELHVLPGGGVLVDTPGVREMGMVGDDGDVEAGFPEVLALAARCRFRDCAHQDEPGCAVRTAVEGGELAADRLEQFHKLEREAAWQARRREESSARAERAKWKAIHKQARRLKVHDPKRRA
jgi:ribosome biogenesis GTPase